MDTKKSENGETVVYNLDRLGVPLVEVATAPDVRSPGHAKETALALGRLLRDTRRVRRGLGSIRQDLNVSIACGDRVEALGGLGHTINSRLSHVSGNRGALGNSAEIGRAHV